ncbi:MAG: FHA domain-containing protein [Eubacterium sp.]
MNYIVSFIYKNHFEQKVIKDGEKITIGSSSKDSIICADYKSSQIIIKNKFFLDVKDKVNKDYSIGTNPIGIHLICREPLTILYISEVKSKLEQYIELPHNAAITVGRSPKCNITIKNQFVSSKHCVIGRENGVYFVEDCASTNGVYVKNLKVSKSKIKSGDEVHIYNYTFKLDSGKITVLNAGNDIVVNSLPSSLTNEKASNYIAGKKPIYQRSPRTQEEMPHDDIVLASPPSKGQKYEKHRGIFGTIAKNPIAKAVKLADLKHNSDLTRLDAVTDKDLKRVEKYKKAIILLEEYND